MGDDCNDLEEILGADTMDLCWGVADEGILLDVNSGIALGQKFWILVGNEYTGVGTVELVISLAGGSEMLSDMQQNKINKG